MPLVLAAAVLWAGAGSALSTSPAFAGGVDGNGNLTAAVYNDTPYTWTLVASGSISSGLCLNRGCLVAPAGTIGPGGASLYTVYPNLSSECFAEFGDTFGYDAYFTYRVDLLGGSPPEYITVGISQAYRSGDCGTSQPSLQVWNTVNPPPAGYDPGFLKAPGPETANPQLAVQLNTPTAFDPTISAVGDFSIDASTDLGQPFVDLLNSVCSGASNTSCSFTQTAPTTYGPGALGTRRSGQSCDLGAAAGAPPPASGDGTDPPAAPPDNDPNFYTIEYTAQQSASLSVGGGLTASTEGELFGAIAAEASVSVEAEHEWEDIKTFAKSAKVYIPPNSWGFVWTAPTIGRVTGTIVATIGSATYTAINFTQERSGVTGTTDPLRQPTPAFNQVTKTRPFTAAEETKYCGASDSSSRLKARTSTPSATLRPGRSVARVALGETQEAIVARLGHPTEKRFALKPCKGLPGCTAEPELGGTWNYKKRNLSVVFGPDRRAVALEYRGNRQTPDGVGRGSTLAEVRGKFPGTSCKRFGKRIDCAVKRTSGQQTTSTVFRFTERAGRRWQTKRVLIHVDGRGVKS